ncbi:MAG: alanine/glycine:cation symporter family protein [Campylobacter sp.]|uniref:alanine/glycine:cation symporter family protein n=1 Tax=Campylobacter sp. TaxID=205 RepID=UPI0029791074|nr:alanine/glycine:cation symporter family protein [Campylobacter sp.]MDD7600135.1 alanine/glycine:cation symporter family protein [Campylobacteraceae bacterium]MDY5887704.1 alanine/glycine:cation symporter family protein [Campylobacter sp.]
MYNAVENFVGLVSGFLYTYWLVFALILCGLYLSFRTGFIQLRFLKDAIFVLREKSQKEHISPFGALMVSTASRVGIGNIVGVAVAISGGGVGALFWMWITAILGGASAFVESTLAQVYKRSDGEHSYKGGPAYYIESALGSKSFGVLFAISLILCFSFGFNGLQSYTLTSAFDIYADGFENTSFKLFIGIIIALLSGYFFFKGAKTTAFISSVLVPAMALGYLLVALFVIFSNIEKLPMIFSHVFEEAFNFEAIFSGFAGSAIVIGIKRGLYSNEAGMGSAPNAAASAHTSHPAKQGMVQTLSVFIDTLMICSCSAFMVLCADIVKNTELKGLGLIQGVMQEHLGSFGLLFVSVAIVLFAFTSIIGNHFYAEANFKFISTSKRGLFVFRLLAMLMVFVGAQLSLSLAWDLADVFMGFMASVNIVAILLLSNIAVRVLKDYQKQRKEGKNPVFKASDVGINNTEFWK